MDYAYSKGLSYWLNYVDIAQIQYYHTCIAPYRNSIVTGEVIRFVENFHKSTAFNKHLRYKNINEELNKFVLCKQYIYYCYDNHEDGWIIILRAADRRLEPENPVVAIGNTLQDAELDFVHNQAQQFTIDYDSIKCLLEKELPLTSREMIDMCTKFDPNVCNSSVKFQKSEYGRLISTVVSNYSFQCSPEETEFMVDVNLDSERVRWNVIRYLNIAHQSSFIKKLPVEASSDSLQEAFRSCKEKLKYLQCNPEALNKAINDAKDEASQQEMEEMRSYDEGTFEWLISEFGEDIIPDRD